MPAYLKINSDMHDRVGSTITVLKACRLFNVYFDALPHLIDQIEYLREELTIYHAAAVSFAADHPEPVDDDDWHDCTFGKLCVTL